MDRSLARVGGLHETYITFPGFSLERTLLTPVSPPLGGSNTTISGGRFSRCLILASSHRGASARTNLEERRELARALDPAARTPSALAPPPRPSPPATFASGSVKFPTPEKSS